MNAAPQIDGRLRRLIVAWLIMVGVYELLLLGIVVAHVGLRLPLPGIVTGPFRVVFIEDVKSDGKPEYEPYRRVLDSTLITHYLREHCIKDAKGNAEWRRWDTGVDVSNDLPELQAMFVTPHERLPWVVIQNEHGQQYSGELPDSIEGTLTLLKKWGGE